MDERPADIRGQIAQTRAALDRDLDRLSAQLSSRKKILAAQAQWWTGISAVIAGSLGAVLLWPRRPYRRRRQPAGYRIPA
jgi:hypothetical protein